MDAVRSIRLWLAMLVFACCPSTLCAAPSTADDEDIPVAEGPADEKPAGREEKAPVAEDDDDLEKALQAQKGAAERTDRLEHAIAGMWSAQKRIAGSDTGIETRRIQEGVVNDLEDLLAQLKKQQNQGNRNSSSNSNQRNQRGKSQPGRGNPQDADPQNSRRRDDNATDSQELSDAARAKAAEDARRSQMIKDVWGHLPPHLREAMRHALTETYLPKYDDLVKKYYEALAQKNRKRAPQ